MNDRPMIGFDVGADGAAIVVVVQADGSHVVHVDGVCKALAAELLQGIADRLYAEHLPGVCSPPPQHDRPAEDAPANPYAGRLDRDRRVYRDPRGDSWDLSLLWRDESDRAWRWHGSTDRLGEPMLRAEDDGEVQPLGVLRALYGPISPRSGGAA
ncbi:phiSA1p31-related protein [Streptomyces sp. NPDC085944]|uniref:phiSA1p31-related protein n=1 Tax=Streptomyces sp. NPDC085944 TaxID=3154962 RepID=UPI00343E577F